jgi:CRP-like cAMP-binding protein
MILNDSFELPVRQELMADALGLTQVHLNRTLAELRRLELIRFERGQMQILNSEALKLAALDE